MRRVVAWQAVCVWVCVLGAGAAWAAGPPATQPAGGGPFANGERICFLGDSITQGGQYVAFFQAYLWAKYPQLKLEVINLGLSSETVNGASEPGHPFPRPCIHDRLDRALAAAKADWVFVCYGMNDGIYYPPSLENLAAYAAGLKRLVAKAARPKAKVVLLTPPPFDAETKRMRRRKLLPAGGGVYGYTKTYEHYDDVLETFAAYVRKEAGSPKVHRVIDLHAPMERYIRHTRSRNAKYLYGDGVHPPIEGHLKMALILLGGLGEDEAAAAKLLTKLTGLELDPSSAKPRARPPLLAAVLRRHRDLSAAWRRHVGHSMPWRSKGPQLDQALTTARQREQEIRQRIAEAMPAAAPAPPAKP